MRAPAYEAVELGVHCIRVLRLRSLASLAFALTLASFLVFAFALALALPLALLAPPGPFAIYGIDVCALLLLASKTGHLILVGRDVLLLLDSLALGAHPCGPLGNVLLQFLDLRSFLYQYEKLPEWQLLEAEELIVLQELAHQYLLKGYLLECFIHLVLLAVPS